MTTKTATTLPAAELALAMGDTDSSLRQLFRSWRDASANYNTTAVGDDTPEAEALFNRIMEMERCAADFEPQRLEDLAFQIIFADDGGDLSESHNQRALAAWAYAFACIDPDE
ncbi:MAG: hypothetical protein NXH97_20945 [Rhodobacteraceae bacterium]|nr:hypothetical protein [Paracoccaceae bacterium]